MLEELKNYNNLWTPWFFWELFQHLRNNDNLLTEEDIKWYFYNKIIDNKWIFDWCIPLLKLSKIIYINEDSKDIEQWVEYRNIAISETLCKQKLLEGFLLAFHKDETFYSILTSEYSSYDIIYKTIQIDYSAFWVKYANIRNLLLDFNFLVKHPDFPNKKLIINPWWKKFFDKYFITEIRKRKIWIDELKQNIEKQQINWEIAEEYVLKYENLRLNNKEWIQWIAPFDCNAWYDILSFDNQESINDYRYIEVKSYTWNIPYFYWTQNEMETAKNKKEKYFLYIVNRDEIKNPNYIPLMISNPYINILEDTIRWDKEINKYFITEIKSS